MQPSACPFCASAVVPQTYSGGTVVVTCTGCAAAWEVHNTMVRRITAPDWDTVRSIRLERGLDPIEPEPELSYLADGAVSSRRPGLGSRIGSRFRVGTR